MNNRKYAFFFYCFCFVLLIVGGIFVLVFYPQGYRVSENKVSISNLSICEGLEDSSLISENVPLVIKGIEQIEICGFLSTRIPVILQIYLYSDESKHPIFRNNLSESFVDGEFIRPVSFNPISSPGSYSIEIYYSRHLLGKIDFKVLHK